MWPRRKYTQLCWQPESKLQEFTADLQSESGRKNCFRIARQMAREGRDVISVCCMKNDVGNVVSDADGMKNIWRKYMEKLINVESDWDGNELMGPVVSFRKKLQQLLTLKGPGIFTVFHVGADLKLQIGM